MKLGKYAIAAMILMAPVDTSVPIAAAAAKNSVSQRDERATQPKSNKGAANSNAQWSADPERGWVPAEEGQRKGATSSSTNQINGKQKATGKSK